MEDTQLSPEQYNLCLFITEELRNSPSAWVFNVPVDQKNHEYYKKIRNPKDLGNIYKNLREGQYKTVVQWESDINLVWSNAETFNGPESTIGNMAKFLKKKFDRLKRPLENLTTTGWTKHLYQLRKKMDLMLLVCPESLRSIVPKNIEHLATTMQSQFNAKEIANLIKASTIIQTPKDIEQISAILMRNEPALNVNVDNLIVDLDNLSTNTLHEVRSYYKKQLIEQGLPYPNENAVDDENQ